MRYIELWEEGYETNGMSTRDQFAGTFWAEDYEDACRQLVDRRMRNPEGWGTVDVMHRVENGVHYWWGCRWYENKTAGSR